MTSTFGIYGGRYVPETLIPALDELTAGWATAKDDPSYWHELHELRTSYAGRPTPLTRAARFDPDRRVYLKREDLLHTGAHKLNNALGQAVLAQRLGKKRIVAETGARAARRRHRHRRARASGSTASSTWAPRTCAARPRTSSGCTCSAPRCARSSSAPER